MRELNLLWSCSGLGTSSTPSAASIVTIALKLVKRKLIVFPLNPS